MNYDDLAKALGITLQDLKLLDFSNQEIFDSSGIAVQNEFLFRSARTAADSDMSMSKYSSASIKKTSC